MQQYLRIILNQTEAFHVSMTSDLNNVTLVNYSQQNYNNFQK